MNCGVQLILLPKLSTEKCVLQAAKWMKNINGVGRQNWRNSVRAIRGQRKKMVPAFLKLAWMKDWDSSLARSLKLRSGKTWRTDEKHKKEPEIGRPAHGSY